MPPSERVPALRISMSRAKIRVTEKRGLLLLARCPIYDLIRLHLRKYVLLDEDGKGPFDPEGHNPVVPFFAPRSSLLFPGIYYRPLAVRLPFVGPCNII